jgi:hypothetical protein
MDRKTERQEDRNKETNKHTNNQTKEPEEGAVDSDYNVLIERLP